MADEKEVKPKSFRINDATAAKFKEISSAIDGNQQETLAKLIEAYEFQTGKVILADRKSDIEQFERYTNAITRMFMGALEDNQNISNTVRTEFEALLQSKDATIQDLQSQLATSKQVKEDATAKAKSYSEENERLIKYIDTLKSEYESKLSSMSTMLNDKEKLNRALTDSCNDLKSKMDTIVAEYDDVADMRKNLADLTQKMAEAEKIISEQKKHEAEALEHCQFEREKAVLDIERKYQEQLQHLKEQKQSEIDTYQQKYFELLEKMQ